MKEGWGWELGSSANLWGLSERRAQGWVADTWHPPPQSSQYHQRVHSQSQQLQQLQKELNKLHKEVSIVRAAHSEVSPLHGDSGWGGQVCALELPHLGS